MNQGVRLQPAIISWAWVREWKVDRSELFPTSDGLGQRRFDVLPEAVILGVTADDQRQLDVW